MPNSVSTTHINQSTQLNLESGTNTTKVVVNNDNSVALNTTCDILTFSQVKVQSDIDIKNHTRAGIEPDENLFTAPEYRKAGSTISEYLKAYSTFDPTPILRNIMTFEASFNIFGLAVQGIKGSNYMNAVFDIAKIGLFVSETRQSDDTHHPNAKLVHDLNVAMMNLGAIGTNLTAGVAGFDEAGYTTQNGNVTNAYTALTDQTDGLQTNYVKLYKSFAAFQRGEPVNVNGIPEYLAISNEFVVVILDDMPETSNGSGVYVNPVTQVRQSEPGTFASAILVNIATTVTKTIPSDNGADTTRIMTAGVGKEFNVLFQEMEDLFARRRKEREKILNDNTLDNVYNATGILINDLQVGANTAEYTITEVPGDANRKFAVKMSSGSEIELLMELTGDGVNDLVVGDSITLAEIHDPARDPGNGDDHPVVDFHNATTAFKNSLQGAGDQARYKAVTGEPHASLETAYALYKTALDSTTIKMNDQGYKTTFAILEFNKAFDIKKQTNYQAVRQIGLNQQFHYKTTADAADDNFTGSSSFLNLSSSSLNDICGKFKRSFNQENYTAATPFSQGTIELDINALVDAYTAPEDAINDLSENVEERFKFSIEQTMETYAATQGIKATASAAAGEQVSLDTLYTVTQEADPADGLSIRNASVKYDKLLDDMKTEIDRLTFGSTDSNTGIADPGVLKGARDNARRKANDFNDYLRGVSGDDTKPGLIATLGKLHSSSEQRLLAVDLIVDTFMNVFGFTKQELVDIMNTPVTEVVYDDNGNAVTNFIDGSASAYMYAPDGVDAGTGNLVNVAQISDEGHINFHDNLLNLLNNVDSDGQTQYDDSGGNYQFINLDPFNSGKPYHIAEIEAMPTNIFTDKTTNIKTTDYTPLYKAAPAP